VIHLEKKLETPPTTNDAADNRFEQIRKAAATQRRLDTAPGRPAIATPDENRPDNSSEGPMPFGTAGNEESSR
jgi:hypothetical protein